MKNKAYTIFYLISIGLSTASNIQTGLAISTGNFVEWNPLGHNWFTILLTILFYLFLMIPFFIKDKGYKKVFLIGIIFLTFLGLGVFIRDFIIVINFID